MRYVKPLFKEKERIMIQAKQNVKTICDKIYNYGYTQIVIDLVQDDIEELLEDEELVRDKISAAAYQCNSLLDVFNPSFNLDIELLIELESALVDWEQSHEFANRVLGLPPES